MGERLLCKQEVVGSIPIASTRLVEMRWWLGEGLEVLAAGLWFCRWVV